MKPTNALISIRHKYCQAILSNRKTVELRKQNFPNTVKRVAIYETKPTRLVVGWFEIEKITIDTPDRIWAAHKDKTGVEEKAFFDYYKNSATAKALHISKTVRLPVPLDLLETFGMDHPPQVFFYLTDEQFARMVKLSGAYFR